MVKKRRKSVVILVAEDANERVVERHEIAYDDYYGEGVALIDSDAYRSNKCIRCVKGQIYDSSGTLQQDFTNSYSETGQYIHGRTVFDDGTVVEN